jgi:hypothetical protein
MANGSSLPASINAQEDIGSRHRIMTAKGREYNSELKAKFALNKEK